MCFPTNSSIFFVPSSEIVGGNEFLDHKDPEILRVTLVGHGFSYRSIGTINELRNESLSISGVVLVASDDLWIKGSFCGLVEEALKDSQVIHPIPILAFTHPNDSLNDYLDGVIKTPFGRRFVTVYQVSQDKPLEYYMSAFVRWARERAQSMVLT